MNIERESLLTLVCGILLKSSICSDSSYFKYSTGIASSPGLFLIFMRLMQVSKDACTYTNSNVNPLSISSYLMGNQRSSLNYSYILRSKQSNIPVLMNYCTNICL